MRFVRFTLAAVLACPGAARAQAARDCGSFSVQVTGAESRSISGGQATFYTLDSSPGPYLSLDLRTHGGESPDSLFVVSLSRARDTVARGTAGISPKMLSPTEFSGAYLRSLAIFDGPPGIVSYQTQAGRLQVTRADADVIEGSFELAAAVRDDEHARVNASGTFRAVRRTEACTAAARSARLMPPEHG